MYVPAENYDDIYDAFQTQEKYAENWAMDDVMEAGGAAAAGSSNSSTASTESAVADTAPAEEDTGETRGIPAPMCRLKVWTKVMLSKRTVNICISYETAAMCGL